MKGKQFLQMPTINTAWGKSISDLLDRHRLTLRAAMLKVGGRPSHTTIKDWMDGIMPASNILPIAFLEHFPREEAIECLRAGGFPIPADWVDKPSIAIDQLALTLEDPRIPEEEKVDLLRRVKELTEKYDSST